ncbi:complement factor B isoform X1 [Catharus ustulatus]|uniref:complement factor B isoform X1 n=1 Tax=Catharus ustulatus TaxID=91951 RepID=UPI00140B2023|nr:complement factor B isoform X1 [Catharus ustulatus]
MAGAVLGLLLLLLTPALGVPTTPPPTPPPGCDPALAPISGGWGELVGGGAVLLYRCPPGSAPSPTSVRRCGPDGTWDPLPGGGQEPPKCQAVFCPAPLEFEHGWFYPRGGRHPPGSLLRYGCSGGFSLRGPAERRCGDGGRWEGPDPVCDDGSGDCPAPAVPPGASMEGSRARFSVEGRVRFRCRPGLQLVGSAERRCLEGGSWSGTEPRCRDPNSFDTPEDVAEAFLASLSQSVEAAEANRTLDPTSKRRISLDAGGALNVFLVLDASRSVNPRDYELARDALSELVEKLASLGASPRYGVVTFGSEARVELSPSEPRANDGAWVREKLGGLPLAAHAHAPGTNLAAALRAVYELLVQQERAEEQQGLRPPPVTNSTRHVIVIMTDGRANMGGSPVPVLHQIQELLSIGRDPRDPRDEFLDVYVFGLGQDAHAETLNALGSKKPGEQHVFFLRETEELQEVFHKMIDESSTLGLCGVSLEFARAEERERNPWEVTVTVTRPGKGQERCQGSLVSPYFVLSAAHCFTASDRPEWLGVDIGPRDRRGVSGLFLHPEFSPGSRRDRGVPEFYDFDVALVQLDKAVHPSPSHRPICIPCTEGASRALRLPEKSSCQDHRRLLLPPKNVEAFFLTPHGSGGLQRQKVLLKLGDQRGPCEADALRAPPYANVSLLSDIVTPRFLCSGGHEPQVDPNACPGDSGGPVVVTWGKRHFQVGVVSWGVLPVCRQRRAPAFARDFHVNLFEVLPWLRERLRDEDLGFLP